ncbi:protein of unknown function DUF1260 [Sulfuricurvum kujiense DSM 16994]|uniref:DUF695 domain-containing protein n=2 Tax=Sulfuricurvum kujiense TaxID=148813 RepID=E4U2K4_SULKY|nr:DUF695 domain-containing protein [Sulfuricurvum kujiense]ADR34691.1 protein of unknown function DUF1260 [Sulfuricurvum kujiense DSM 16994]
MQEYWELYMKQIDGAIASVLVNAGISAELPSEDKYYVGFIKLTMKAPNDRGLIGEDEEAQLSFIEDKIEMEALRYRIGNYVGKIVSNGEMTFIYYLKHDFEWPDVVQAAMGAFPDYGYTYGSKMDGDWEVYHKLLFPTPIEWQIIQNHKVCDHLKSQGDSLHLPRAIEHKAYFETAEKRSEFVSVIEAEGFKIKEHMEPNENTSMAGVSFYRQDKPFYYDIDALTLRLIDLSVEFKGAYDGWETSVVKI